MSILAKPTIHMRLSMLRLDNHTFARLVGVNPKTVWNWRNTRMEPHPIIARRVEAELTKLELPVLDHLLAIHGVPTGEGE